MAIYIARLKDVGVELTNNGAMITIALPQESKDYIYNEQERRELEKDHWHKKPHIKWLIEQISEIMEGSGKGSLAIDDYPMRSPGAGVLPRVKLKPGDIDRKSQEVKNRSEENDSQENEIYCTILHVRGTNRGQVWPVGGDIAHVLCWKEFAGITGSAEELIEPRITAIKELYEELSLVLFDKILLPGNICHNSYADAFQHLEIALQRINRHYHFNLSFDYGHYKAVEPRDLDGNNNTEVVIIDRQRNKLPFFKSIVNYDPFTNTLELSFLTTLEIEPILTGIMSLAGPENNDVNLKPFMEDIIVVKENELLSKNPGDEIQAKHLLSVHGPTNFIKTKSGQLFYNPSPTFKPIVSQLEGNYSFKAVLGEAKKILKLRYEKL